MTDTKRQGMVTWASGCTGQNVGEILEATQADELTDSGWPEFLPPGIRELWSQLTPDARLICYVVAWQALQDFDVDALL